MKIRLPFIFLLLAVAFSARADHGANEPRLSAKSQALRVEILKEALHDKRITKAQYEQSVSWVYSTPCDGVDRSFNTKMQTILESAISKEQHRKRVRVFESFRLDGWSILFTDASDGDEPYLFYSNDPVKGAHPVTAWSGAATLFETNEIAQWVSENSPGIPVQLANCFAWHVTLSTEVRND